MKEGSILLLIFILTFTMTGCKQKLARWKSSTDKDIYINYEYERVIIGLLAVKDLNGNLKIVVNTCQSCRESSYFFIKQDSLCIFQADKLEARNAKKLTQIGLVVYLSSKSSSIFHYKAIKVEVGQPLFFDIIGSNKLLTDISIPWKI